MHGLRWPRNTVVGVITCVNSVAMSQTKSTSETSVVGTPPALPALILGSISWAGNQRALSSALQVRLSQALGQTLVCCCNGRPLAKSGCSALKGAAGPLQRVQGLSHRFSSLLRNMYFLAGTGASQVPRHVVNSHPTELLLHPSLPPVTNRVPGPPTPPKMTSRLEQSVAVMVRLSVGLAVRTRRTYCDLLPCM